MSFQISSLKSWFFLLNIIAFSSFSIPSPSSALNTSNQEHLNPPPWHILWEFNFLKDYCSTCVAGCLKNVPGEQGRVKDGLKYTHYRERYTLSWRKIYIIKKDVTAASSVSNRCSKRRLRVRAGLPFPPPPGWVCTRHVAPHQELLTGTKQSTRGVCALLFDLPACVAAFLNPSSLYLCFSF